MYCINQLERPRCNFLSNDCGCKTWVDSMLRLDPNSKYSCKRVSQRNFGLDAPVQEISDLTRSCDKEASSVLCLDATILHTHLGMPYAVESYYFQGGGFDRYLLFRWKRTVFIRRRVFCFRCCSTPVFRSDRALRRAV